MAPLESISSSINSSSSGGSGSGNGSSSSGKIEIKSIFVHRFTLQIPFGVLRLLQHTETIATGFHRSSQLAIGLMLG